MVGGRGQKFLIEIAVVVIGGLILAVITRGVFPSHPSAGPGATAPTTTQSTATTANPRPSATIDVGATSTTPRSARPASEVFVVVLNAAGISGLAARAVATLQSDGYSSVVGGSRSIERETTVAFAAGYEADARSVATALAIHDPVLEQVSNWSSVSLPVSLPVSHPDVLVILGAER